MNRSQRRAVQRGKAKGLDLNDPRQAQEMLENLPTATLIAGINNSLDILQKRGVPISDWDNKKRELYRLKVYGGRVCFLAAEIERKTPETDAGNTCQKDSGTAPAEAENGDGMDDEREIKKLQ